MLERWGRFVHRRRWAVLAAALVAMVVAGLWGTGVFGALQASGGFTTPGSDSEKATRIAERDLGRDEADVVVLYRSAGRTVDDPAFKTAVTGALAALPKDKVTGATTYWSSKAPQLVSGDRTATYAVLQLAGADEQARSDSYSAIKDRLKDVDGATAQVGGSVATETTVTDRVSEDIARGEAISVPILVVLLVIIFGGLAAASLPLAIGGLAILGSFTALHLLTLATDVSIFAVNITTFLGLGLAIDYGLFVVARFREELRRAAGPDAASSTASSAVPSAVPSAGSSAVPDALARTMATAGRTVAVSGITVAVSLAGLMLFPQMFLRSMGYGGVATVVVCMLAALTVLPALLAVLGPRVNALSLRRRRRGAAASDGFTAADRPAGAHATPEGARSERPGSGSSSSLVSSGSPGSGSYSSSGSGSSGSGSPGSSGSSSSPGSGGRGWYRLAHSVMRRPLIYVIVTVALLVSLGAPFLGINWGGVDGKVLPAGAEARVVAETLETDFPRNATTPIDVVLTGRTDPGVYASYAQRLQQVPGVTAAQVTGAKADTAKIAVRYDADPMSGDARDLVERVRDVPVPPGTTAYVGGTTADTVDQLSSLGSILPWLALLVGVATFVLLFLAFGSVVLPLKAILMNMLSLSATYGVMVLIFQEGHLSGLLDFTATGSLAPAMPILMLAMLFGISMDYEVFLLSRVREQYDLTGDNTAAVASGLQRTGGIITSAALLFIVVMAGFSVSGITFIKMTGVGMITAIIIDATIVRALLVPATMRLLGRVNWWAPGPLARLYRRYGIREEEARPREPALVK